MKSFIIHLDRATAREGRVNLLRSQLPGTVEVVSAIDGRSLTHEQRAQYQRHLHRPRYPFPMRDSEIACFLSHRKTWQTIIDGTDPYALVAEDDIFLDSDLFATALALVRENMTPDSFIRFPIIPREIPAATIAKSEKCTIFHPKMVGLGMQLQLIGRNYAKTLLHMTQVFDRPVDTLLQMVWTTGVQPTAIWPSGVREMDTEIGGSLIGSKKFIPERLWRELVRPLYRVQIAVRARQ